MRKPKEGSKRYLELDQMHKDLSRKNIRIGLVYLADLARHAVTLRKLFEHECNGCTRDKLPGETWEQYDRARVDQLAWVEQRIEKERELISRKCAFLEVPYYIQGDPRGPSLYLGTSSSASYSTEGVAIW